MSDTYSSRTDLNLDLDILERFFNLRDRAKEHSRTRIELDMMAMRIVDDIRRLYFPEFPTPQTKGDESR